MALTRLFWSLVSPFYFTNPLSLSLCLLSYLIVPPIPLFPLAPPNTTESSERCSSFSSKVPLVRRWTCERIKRSEIATTWSFSFVRNVVAELIAISFSGPTCFSCRRSFNILTLIPRSGRMMSVGKHHSYLTQELVLSFYLSNLKQ